MDQADADNNKRAHAKSKPSGLSPKKEKRIVRRGKWKARLSNTLTVLSAFLAISIISSILTALFYGMGDPSRNDKYPGCHCFRYLDFPSQYQRRTEQSGQSLLMQEVYGDMKKRVGDDRVTVGEYSVNFLFGLPSVKEDWNGLSTGNSQVFQRPNGKSEASPPANTKNGSDQQSTKESKAASKSGDWSGLRSSPRVLSAEAYISFNRFFSTDSSQDSRN